MAFSDQKALLGTQKKPITPEDIATFENAPEEIFRLNQELKKLKNQKNETESELKSNRDLLWKEHKLNERKEYIAYKGQISELKKELFDAQINQTDDELKSKIATLKTAIQDQLKSADEIQTELKEIEQITADANDYAQKKARQKNLSTLIANSQRNLSTEGPTIAQLQSEKKEIDALEKKVLKNKSVLEDHERLTKLKTELETCNNNHRTLQQDLQTALNDESNRAAILAKIAMLEEKCKPLNPMEYQNYEISRVLLELKQFTPEKMVELNNKVEELKAKIEKLNIEIKRVNDDLQLQTQIENQAHPILRQLSKNPESLYQKLLTQANVAFARFKRSFPRENGFENEHKVIDQFYTRIYLLELLEKSTQEAQEIQKKNVNPAESKRSTQNSSSINSAFTPQEKCFYLCGLLNYLISQFQDGILKSNVLEPLNKIMSDAHLDIESAQTVFVDLFNGPMKKIVKHYRFDDANSHSLDRMKYEKALQNLQKTLMRYQSGNINTSVEQFLSSAKSLLNTQANETNLAYLTKIFNTTDKLLRYEVNVRDADKIKKYSDRLKSLATEMESEQPSLRMQLGGVAIMVISALSVILGTIAKFVTFGLSTPVSTAMITGGVVGFFGGSTLYRRGARHTGISAQVLELRDAICNMDQGKLTTGTYIKLNDNLNSSDREKGDLNILGKQNVSLKGR